MGGWWGPKLMRTLSGWGNEKTRGLVGANSPPLYWVWCRYCYFCHLAWCPKTIKCLPIALGVKTLGTTIYWLIDKVYRKFNWFVSFTNFPNLRSLGDHHQRPPFPVWSKTLSSLLLIIPVTKHNQTKWFLKHSVFLLVNVYFFNSWPLMEQIGLLHE